jgi:isoquinoline 1-oxidoreductase subunit alpha
MTTINFNVNGQDHTLEAAPEMPLLWALRDLLGLTGTKYGCGQGECGACTVHVDGQAIRSCITAVERVAGHMVTTIEGLSEGAGHAVQRAWLEDNVSQCGYCQPGQIMAAAALLASDSNPTDVAINDAMSGVLCRCGTYTRIRKAIRRAVSGGGS